MRTRRRKSQSPRPRQAAVRAFLPAAVACLLALGACGSRDKELSEAELANTIERQIPPGPDRSPEDRRAAAEALARDVMDLAADVEAAADVPAEAIEPANSPEQIRARECEQLAVELAILRRRIEFPAPDEQFTPQELAALPAELATREARYADTCP